MKESEKSTKKPLSPKIVEVIPLLKGLPRDALTYFYTGEITEGNLVEIEVRSTRVQAIVSKVRDARDDKSNVKSSTFQLRKIKTLRPGLGLGQAFVRAAERTAHFYATSTSAILGSLIPKIFLEESNLLTFNFPSTPRNSKETLLIQLEREERFFTYRSIIREHLARKNSVIFIAPSNELAKRAYEDLSPGIDEYVHLFTSDLKKSQKKKILTSASESAHCILFITTPAGAVFDRADLSTIILDEESSRSLRTHVRPLMSYKTFIEFYAHASGKELILGDTVLTIESLYKAKQGKYAELISLKWRVNEAAKTRIIDMKKLKDATGSFEIFSSELKNLAEETLMKGKTIFLFGARKGLAPSTVCGDCGHILECQNCGAPIVLHLLQSEPEKNLSEARMYVCHACGASRSPETRCDNCESWKLVPLGIGIDRIAEEAHQLWKDIPLFIFDRDHVKDARAAESLAAKIANTPQAIIIGTELFLPYSQSVTTSAVVSLDALFSIPDFSINERIFSLITKLRELSDKEVLIQTRNIGQKIILDAAKGDILSFYKDEIVDRRMFLYPPFSIFIKVTKEVSARDLSETAADLSARFANWNPEYTKRRGSKANTFVVGMIIRLVREEWPDAELLEELLLLDRDFLITVDPESIL